MTTEPPQSFGERGANAERVLATYRIETPLALDRAAEAMAGEQSSGTFVPVPGETKRLIETHGARVERVTDRGPIDHPSLPGSRSADEGSTHRQGEVVLSFPLVNIGDSLPSLLTMVAGNIFELSQLSAIRLVDIAVPSVFARAQPGPQFGVDGTRELTGVHLRPVIGTIVKPSVGLSPDQTAGLVDVLADAGVDFIKDDELIASPPYSPLPERVGAVMKVINRHADRTGKRVMYAFNITANPDDMARHHDLVVDAGGTCVMMVLNSVGLAGFDYVRRRSGLPIHGHRAGWGALTRCPALGFEFGVYQKLWRLAGVDHLHVNGLRNKFWEPDESVVASARGCLDPAAGTSPIMPVISSGQSAGHAPDTYQAIGSVDLIHLAGGGILAHPSGPRAGVASLRQSWEAALTGISLKAHAERHPELREALATFGGG